MATDLEERVLTVAEAAALLRVSPRSAYAAIHRGELPGIAIGRRLVVPGAALARMLADPRTSFPLESEGTANHLFANWQEGGEEDVQDAR
jgi:excisionase family DNA binding protein